jgi:hypothetical protein
MSMVYDLISWLWLPFLFIFIASFILWRIKIKAGTDASKEVIGIALGVILGFVSQITFTSFNEFQKEQQLKTIAFKLLKQDAVDIYECMRGYELMNKSNETIASKPNLIKYEVPFNFGEKGAGVMNYWPVLRKDYNILLLANDERFNEIFRYFYGLETIGSLMDQYRLNGNKQARNIAMGMFNSYIKEGFHRKLLLHFMSTKDIDKLDKK